MRLSSASMSFIASRPLLSLETRSDDLYHNGQTAHIISTVLYCSTCKLTHCITLDLVSGGRNRKHEFIKRAELARVMRHDTTPAA